MSRIALIVFGLALSPFVATAQEPVFPSPADVRDYQTVLEPEVATAYHGELTGFPHTFSITATEAFYLFTQLAQPQTTEPDTSLAIIVVKEEIRGVSEVMRMRPETERWTERTLLGNTYWSAPEYRAELEAGNYLVEVSTPDNQGKYVLFMGERDESDLGYFSKIARGYQVKEFLGQSGIGIVFTPLVMVPLLGLILVLGLGWWLYRRYYA